MNKKLRKWLEQNGLRASATEQEAWTLYDEKLADGIELPGIEPGERSAATGAPAEGAQTRTNSVDDIPVNTDTPGQRTYSQAELELIVDQRAAAALKADTARRAEVQGMIDVAAVGDLDGGQFARNLLDNPDIDAARASQAILTELKKRNTPIGSGAQVGTEAPEKLRSAVTDSLLLRSGHRMENPAEGAREFRGRTLLEIGKELLEIGGENTRGVSKLNIAGRMLASGSTSDFSLILSGLVSTRLLDAYNEWPSTWRAWVAITEATDFKDIHAYQLSGAPDLKGLDENGEYKTAKFSESGSKYRIITKGIRVPLTRQMIINDDLRAFTRIPQLFGVSAKRMESDAVYDLLTSNPVMGDGTALFHADRKNIAGTGTAITSGSLGVGRTAMRLRKGLAGEMLDIAPAFLLTSVMKETDAEVILRSSALPESSMSAGVHNPWAGKLTPIADPHLDNDDDKCWYLMAHPNQSAVIEAAFLEGEEQPYVEEQIDFNSDALVIKVRHDFGAGVADHVGAYKNPGA